MKLGTIYLEVGDASVVERLRDFYRDVIGLALRSEEPGESVWFDAGGVALGFHAAPEPEKDPGVVNLSFDVDDADAEAARLEAAGVKIAQGPMDAPWSGGRVAVLFDPAGHTVWLSGPAGKSA